VCALFKNKKYGTVLIGKTEAKKEMKICHSSRREKHTDIEFNATEKLKRR
jgi:hypothetical protein